MLELVIIILIAAELISFAGQLFYKKTLNKIDMKRYKDFLVKALTSYTIWIGFFCIALGIVVWLIALSFTELNIIYSLDSMSYIIALFGSRVFLGERLDKHKIGGTLLIVLGLVLVVMS